MYCSVVKGSYGERCAIDNRVCSERLHLFCEKHDKICQCPELRSWNGTFCEVQNPRRFGESCSNHFECIKGNSFRSEEKSK